MALISRVLDVGWTVTPGAKARPGLPETIAAEVPGTVHTDLLAAGLIPDPYLDLNEIATDWVGRADWTYRTTFEWSDEGAERVELVFDGLDTVAEIALNGVVLAQTRNMNRTYRLDVTDRLVAGSNGLEVRFRSAWAYGEDVASQFEPRPNNYPGPANLMRKMACNFGWDWGPSLVTCGIWKPVRLESWSGARLARVRPMVTLDGGNGRVRVEVEIAGAAEGGPLTLTAEIAGQRASVSVPAGATSAGVELVVPEPQIWWPAGMGAQPLYDLAVTLGQGEAVLDGWSKRVGFRSIRLDTTADAIGSAFTLVINDVPIFARGANWIPDDCFLPRVSRERYRQRIEQALGANITLLRIWGGGIYEQDAFYELCDELGVMVWQDFLFACAAYPEEGHLPEEIEAEARDNVVRLMPHPSLILWNGNNENIWGFFDWGWQNVLEGRSWGLGYYLELLPRIVAELDPTRPYWAGSPYSGSMDIHPNADGHGCKHIWDVWNDVGYEHYRDHVPRFCSEFGWQAPPTWATLQQSIHDTPMSATSPGVQHHQKATNGNAKLLRGLEGHLPEPQNFDDWLFATQLNQARAIRFGIEHLRSHRPVCMGAIVWQLNDCWPVTSWAAIDGYGRLKPLWYALKAAYDDHLLTIQPRPEGLTVFAINERSLFWRGPVDIKRVDFDGNVLEATSLWRLCADRFSSNSTVVPDAVATPGNPRRELLVATMHDSKAFWFFGEDVDLDLPGAGYALAVSGGEGDWFVTVTARTLLKDLCIFADRLHPDATVDAMLVTLLPGESHRFAITLPGALSEADLRRAGVIRTANDLCAPQL